VSRAIARGGAATPTRRKRKSLLDPFRAQVDQLLAEGVWNAQVIFRELQTRGYTGKLSILRDYIRPKRALRPGRVTVRFETEPGRQLQSDWGEIRTRVGGVETDVHFCVNTLGYSRRFHFWCTDREDAEHTYEGLIRSFEPAEQASFLLFAFQQAPQSLSSDLRVHLGHGAAARAPAHKMARVGQILS
jgi:transposase